MSGTRSTRCTRVPGVAEYSDASLLHRDAQNTRPPATATSVTVSVVVPTRTTSPGCPPLGAHGATSEPTPAALAKRALGRTAHTGGRVTTMRRLDHMAGLLA